MAWGPSRVSDAPKRSKRRRIHAMRLINQNRTGQPWVKPGNDVCASSGHMRRYREPFPVLLRPAIGVAPVRLLSVRRGVTGRGMDDGEVAHDADLYIMRPQILDRHRLRGLLKEGGAVDQQFVGICGIELRRQDFIEAPNVGILHRGDEVAIERGEFVDGRWSLFFLVIKHLWWNETAEFSL